MAYDEGTSVSTRWTVKQVLGLAAFCFAAGLLLGYLGAGTSSPARNAAPQPEAAAAPAGAGMPHAMPTREQMKSMAEKQAAPLLQQLQKDPNNAGLLNEIGNVYVAAHQFPEAASYYERSLRIDPKNVKVRANKASLQFYSGDTAGAIATLKIALREAPNDPRVLFNLGVMRWKGEHDAAGAIQLWQKLLKSNPDLPAGTREEVQKLIAEARK